MELDDRETLKSSIGMCYEMQLNFVPTPDLDIFFENANIYFSVERATYMVDNDDFLVTLKNHAYSSQEYHNLLYSMKKVGWVPL
jgi:hypothetical protein